MEAKDYFSHLGIEISDDEIAHYGRKGMKWGIRKDDRGGSESGASRWTDDQKQKAKNVAVVAGVVGVGAAYVALQLYSHRSGSLPSPAKGASGKKLAEDMLKAKGGQKLAMDPELRAFIKDAPNRILSDQKGWSNAMGKSLGGIQKDDAKFMADYIKNNVPKALGA